MRRIWQSAVVVRGVAGLRPAPPSLGHVLIFETLALRAAAVRAYPIFEILALRAATVRACPSFETLALRAATVRAEPHFETLLAPNELEFQG